MTHFHSFEDLLKFVTLVCSGISAAIILWYLLKRPALSRPVKFALLAGLGIFPAGVVLAGNIAGFQYTMRRPFCGSCHVMGAYYRDAADPNSKSLASIHSRNEKFGGESCYVCHADHKMLGPVITKLNGLKHLYYYVTEYAYTGPDGEGGPTIHLYKPFKNENCEQCHSTTAPRWSSVSEHQGMLADIRSGEMSCIGCHDQVHPTALTHRTKTQAKNEEVQK